VHLASFWTTPQPGGAYGNHTEPFNALQVTISALSTGPVQPSDAVNHSDVRARSDCEAR
jgi:hypothetical protein